MVALLPRLAHLAAAVEEILATWSLDRLESASWLLMSTRVVLLMTLIDGVLSSEGESDELLRYTTFWEAFFRAQRQAQRMRITVRT